MIPASEALERLREGNQRFAEGRRATNALLDPLRRAGLAHEQEPFAIVLGCSDSRVPAELVFDQGLGDLFVIRVAGNIVAPSQVGSVEFAAERFGSRLVVVLGHSRCGVIDATIETLENPGGPHSRYLRSIVNRVRPPIELLLRSGLGATPEQLRALAVRANVVASVTHLRHGSEVLEQLIREHGLQIVGAEYSLATGLVDFFEVGPGA